MTQCSSPCQETGAKPGVSRLVNKLVLACILIPSGFWAIEKIVPHVQPQRLVAATHRIGQKIARYFRRELYQGMRSQQLEAITELEEVIDTIEAHATQIEPFDPVMAASQRKQLASLKAERLRLLAMNEEELTALGAQVIADVNRQICEIRSSTSRQELQLTLQKSQIQYDAAVAAAGEAQQPAATRMLQSWLHAVEKSDLPTAVGLMTGRAASGFSAQKMQLLQAHLGGAGETLQVARRSDGRIGYVIGDDADSARLFVGILSNAEGVLIDSIELDF